MAAAAVVELTEGAGTEEWRHEVRRFRPRAQMGAVRWLREDLPATIDAKRGLQNPLVVFSHLDQGRVVDLNWRDVANRRNPGVVRLLVRVETNLPGETFLDIHEPGMTLDVSCFRWRGPKVNPDTAMADSVPMPVERFHLRRAEYDTLKSEYESDFWLERPLQPPAGIRSGDYYVCRFAFHADPYSLRLPPWVTEWSTDDDNDPEMIRQTLNLKRVLGSIVRTTSLDNPLFTGFLIVHGGNR
jgi:hypothetical protein